MSIFIVIIVICWAAFILYWGISAFNVKRDINSSPWSRFAWLRIVLAAIVVSVLWKRKSLGVLTHQGGILSVIPLNTTLAFFGVVLCVLGTALAVWARVHLGRNWSSHPSLKEGHELITSGPYSLVRHPIYTGIIVATIGTGLVIPVWLVIFVIVSGMFIWRVKVEEAIMTKQFPDKYPEYKKRTWVLVPWVW